MIVLRHDQYTQLEKTPCCMVNCIPVYATFVMDWEATELETLLEHQLDKERILEERGMATKNGDRLQNSALDCKRRSRVFCAC